jgi:hypothetical protein
MQAQGCVVWSADGVMYGNYQGAPDSTYSLYGSWIRPVMRKFFGMYRDAGLKPGCCIRHQELEDLKDDQTKQPPSAFEVMYRKLYFAYKEWGCRIFYFDSNGDPNLPLPVHYFEWLHKAFPDCLLIPEHETPEYYQYGVPYRDGGREGFAVPVDVFKTVPNALCAPNVNTEISDEQIREIMMSGCPLLLDAWKGAPMTEAVGRVAKTVVLS